MTPLFAVASLHSYRIGMSLVIREAVPEIDWPTGIWPIFQAVVAAEDCYPFPADVDEATARNYWLQPQPAKVFVALQNSDGAILGTYCVKANQPGFGAHVANAAFMVATSAQGQGVGRALAQHALAWARGAGFTAMQFNYVVSTNTAAVALWKDLGFSIAGTLPEAFEHRKLGRRVDVFIMHRFL